MSARLPSEVAAIAGLIVLAISLAASLWRTGTAARQARIRAIVGGGKTPARVAGAHTWAQRLGQVVSSSPVVGMSETRKLATLLYAAGLRQRGALAGFIALKTLVALLGLVSAWLCARAAGPMFAGIDRTLGAVVAGTLAGWRLPDLAAHLLARRRRAAVEDALPDALDLLVICAESGLALEQGLERIARELRGSAPVLADELGLAVAEMRLLPDRWQALENFASRTRVRSLHSIVATLVQTLRYGTPLAQSLRVIAAEMRTARALRIEARAARLPVLLTIPLILFILPCVFIVVAGPTALQVYDVLHRH